MSFIFFFSYAREDNNEHLERFYEDLVERVRLKTGASKKDVGFRDTISTDVGENWLNSIWSGINTAKVFVYLHSPTYFGREWCGREWTLFQQRIKKTRINSTSLMLPILWTTDFQPPACVKNIQNTHHSFGEIYSTEGLYFLKDQEKFKDQYNFFISEFSKRIIKLSKGLDLCTLDKPIDYTRIPNAFENQTITYRQESYTDRIHAGPKVVQFVYVAGKADEVKKVRKEISAYHEIDSRFWRPYFPKIDDEIALIAQSVAAELKKMYEYIPFSENILDRINESLSQNTIVIILIDSWTLQLSAYQEIMINYDKTLFRNSEAIVIIDINDDETKAKEVLLQKSVVETFSNHISTESTSLQTGIVDYDGLRTRIKLAIDNAFKHITSYSKHIRSIEGPGFEKKPTISANVMFDGKS